MPDLTLAPLMMSPEVLTGLILALGAITAGLVIWVVAEPAQPDAIISASLAGVLKRVEAKGGRADADDVAEIERLLGHAKAMKISPTVREAATMLLSRASAA